VVWGPGVLGTAILRQRAGGDDVEVGGVRCYADAKKGQDVGTFLGQDPTGVLMTTDRDEVLALRPDVVLICPQATAGAELGSQATDDVLALLRAGINVVAANGYHHPAFHGGELQAALESACEQGGSSLHGTGINPGLVSERFLTTLTAAMTTVESVVVQEVGVGGTVESADMMAMIG